MWARRVNLTPALFGFTNPLLDLIEREKPTHMGVAFDTTAPTERHGIYSEYKANREMMPEDLKMAIPYVREIIVPSGLQFRRSTCRGSATTARRRVHDDDQRSEAHQAQQAGPIPDR